MNDIENLKQEIKILKKRVEILESIENKRKITKNLNIIIRICLLLLIVFLVYTGYNYVTENIPNIIESKVKDINILKR